MHLNIVPRETCAWRPGRFYPRGEDTTRDVNVNAVACGTSHFHRNGVTDAAVCEGGLTRNVGGHKHPRQRGALEEAQQQEYDRTVGQTHRHPQQAGQAGGHEEAAPTTQPEKTCHVELHHSKHKHARACTPTQFEFRLDLSSTWKLML